MTDRPTPQQIVEGFIAAEYADAVREALTVDDDDCTCDSDDYGTALDCPMHGAAR